MHRTLDVLDRMLAHVLEDAGHFPLDVVANHFGQGYAAHRSERLQPRGHVNALAINVVTLDDNFSQIDANAVAYALGFGDLSSGLLRCLLYRQRAIHGGNDTGELDQRAVAQKLEHAATMGSNFGIENSAAVGL